MAYGNGSGLVIVDVVQFVCLLNMGTADLYGSLDPFQRMPKSPRPCEGSPSDFIQKVDLSNYSQVTEKKSSNDNNESKETDKLLGASGGQQQTPVPKDIQRVKSPDCRRLQKGSSSNEESSFSKVSNFRLLLYVMGHEAAQLCLAQSGAVPRHHPFKTKQYLTFSFWRIYNFSFVESE